MYLRVLDACAVDYFFFFTFCVSAEPATDLTAFDDDFELKSFDALEATFALVVSPFFAISKKPLPHWLRTLRK